MTYVDGFVVPVPKKNIDTYRRMSRKAGKIWIEHGALDYKECVGDDLNIKGVLSFTKGTKVKAGETIVFAFITYKSRAHRDRVNKKVMADPRLGGSPTDMPFDHKRMMYGGFKAIVDLVAQPK